MDRGRARYKGRIIWVYSEAGDIVYIFVLTVNQHNIKESISVNYVGNMKIKTIIFENMWDRTLRRH